MGVGGSQPALRAEVRIELPETASPPGSVFFARLHTAAVDWSKYKVWGQPQQVGLFPDDIITVSIHTAKSEAHFDMNVCEDFAELYIPWERIEKDLPFGQEVAFRLALTRGIPRLGHHSSPSEFQDSFIQALQRAKGNQASSMVIAVRRLPDENHLQEERLRAERASAIERQQALQMAMGQREVSPGPSRLPLSPRRHVVTSGSSTPPASVPKLGVASGSSTPTAGGPARSSMSTGRSPPTAGPQAPRIGASAATPPRSATFMRSGGSPAAKASTSPSPARNSPASNSSMISRPRTPAPAGAIPATSPAVSGNNLSSVSPSGARSVAASPAKVIARGVPGRMQAPSPPRTLVTIPASAKVLGSTTPPQPRPMVRPLMSGAEAPRARLPGSVTPPAPWQTSGSTSVASYGVEELSAEDMRMLRQMQVQNERLRQQLGLPDEAVVPEAEEAKRMHMGRLEQAIQNNFDLRAKLQNADKDLAIVNVSIASLSREERLALTSGGLTPPPSSMNLIKEDQAEVKRQTDKVMNEIHEVTRANIDLIREQEKKLKIVEKELSISRRQHQQLVAQANSRTTFSDKQNLHEQLQSYDLQMQVLMKNSHEIEEAIKQEQQTKFDSEFRMVQKMKTERDVFLDEIENLRRSLERNYEEDPLMDSMHPPATAVLSVEAAQLTTQLAEDNDRGVQEQGALEQQVEELRRLTKEYKDQLQTVLAEKEKAQAELQELRETRDGNKAIERERTELLAKKETVAGHAGRSRMTIKVYDEKIAELKKETDDIRQRVQAVSGNR